MLLYLLFIPGPAMPHFPGTAGNATVGLWTYGAGGRGWQYEWEFTIQKNGDYIDYI